MENINDGVLSPIPAPKTKKRVNMSAQVKERRRRVLKRLEEQLKSGFKPEKGVSEYEQSVVGTALLPLEEKDINRIKKDIEILKGRI